MNHKQLTTQMAELKTQLDSYKTELASVRRQLDTYQNTEIALPSVVNNSPTTRRRMLKRFAAGVAGVGAISLAAAVNGANQTALAQAVSSDNAIDATSGPVGYALRADSAFAPIRLVPSGSGSNPPTDVSPNFHQVGEMYVSSDGSIWFCVASGSSGNPAKWRKLGGPNTAGSLQYLDRPERYIDTRPGASNFGGVSGAIPAVQTRTFQLTGHNGQSGNSSLQIPTGATAITGHIFSLDGSGGYLTVYPTGATPPDSATLFYSGGPGGSAFSTKLGTNGSINIFASTTTNVTMDVVGFYL